MLPTFWRITFSSKSTKNGVVNLIKIPPSEIFPSINKKIPLDKIATQEDMGTGIMDCSLRGRHELNIELLKRIGFELENL